MNNPSTALAPAAPTDLAAADFHRGGGRHDWDPDRPRLSKAEKAAVILLVLGPEAAAGLLSNFGDQQIRNFASAVNELREVSASAVDQVISEFLSRLADTGAIEGGRAETKRFLKQALGDEELNRIVGDLEGADRTVWSLLADIQDPALAIWLKGEHPQVAAIVLSQLSPSKAAGVLEAFDPPEAREIILRMGAATQADPKVTDRIADAISRDFLPMARMKASRLDPSELIAEVMNHVSSSVRDELIDAMSTAAPDLAKSVVKVMFTFNHITERVNPRDVGLVVKAVDENTLFMALKSDEERVQKVRTFIFENISKRLGERMAEDLDAMEAPTKKERESAQGELVAVITELRDSGAIKMLENEADE